MKDSEDTPSKQQNRVEDRSRHLFDPTTTATGQAVITAVANHRDQDPMALPPLGETIDSEALHAFVRSIGESDAQDAAWIEFQYAGLYVLVTATGSITVSSTRIRPT